MSERSHSIRYTEAVESFVEFARTLTDDEWATHVPCTPLWTARDVLSHVSGLPDDGIAGRMEGAPGEAWTQSQVERNAELTVDELLTRLTSQYEMFGGVLDQIGEGRPPLDCHSHEHDVRQAVGRPGNQDSAIIDDASKLMLLGLADLPVGLTVTFDDRSEHVLGATDGASSATLSVSKFDMFRSRLGRRTRDQVRAFDWSGDDDAVESAMAGWFMFGPSEIAIAE
ncbi:MAG: maleylpyruvate isomerase N-terminal domain-containing protein [Ilumatobacter sp.]|uniref:maleylpyruvate isomerase N-terminal domain-containing protein n=1 Tax=Ilumatobacter sp. TaxID=1967498 RepID=UPI003C753389